MTELTKHQALTITLELWEYLAKTGGDGYNKQWWEGWARHGIEPGGAGCALCVYAGNSCTRCPYYVKYGHCLAMRNSPYRGWVLHADESTRKYWAHRCVNRIKELINET